MLNTAHRRRQSGLSIVELLVGVTVGLFLMGGAITMFVVNLKSSRQLLLEARVNQDLRAAADLIARDLRRAGYWENAIAGTVTDASGAAAKANSYSGVSLTGNNEINYSVARDFANNRGGASNTLDTREASDEDFGFVLDGNVLKMKFGRTLQPLTDPNIVTINEFVITPDNTTLDIRSFCVKTCTSGCPQITLRNYQILLKGTATHDSKVVRVLKHRVRLRTEELTGACPL